MIDEAELTRLYMRFTQRQREVVHLTSEGLSNNAIAARLCIASSVVAEHLTNIYGEIGTHPAFAEQLTNRYTVIRLYTGFIARHPELDPFHEDASV